MNSNMKRVLESLKNISLIYQLLLMITIWALLNFIKVGVVMQEEITQGDLFKTFSWAFMTIILILILGFIFYKEIKGIFILWSAIAIAGLIAPIESYANLIAFSMTGVVITIGLSIFLNIKEILSKKKKEKQT